MKHLRVISALLIEALLLGLVPWQIVKAQGLDLNLHCSQHERVRAVNIDGTAYGWRCEDAQGNLHSISVQDACNEQYGAGRRAEFRDMSDENSWYCAQSAQLEPPPPPNPPVAAPAAPAVQQSQPESQSAAAPVHPAWTVTDGCTDHPEQVYTGESSPPSGDYLKVNVSNLRVRMGPGTNHCFNGYAVQDRYYPLHNVKGSWALITGTYGAGWVHTDYVTLYGSYGSPSEPQQDESHRYTRHLIRTCDVDPFMVWYFSDPTNLLMFDLNAPSQAAEIVAVLLEGASAIVQYSQLPPARVVVRDMRDTNTGQYVSDVTWYDHNGMATQVETYTSETPIAFCGYYITFLQEHNLTG